MTYRPVLLISLLILGGLALVGGFVWWSQQMHAAGLSVSQDVYLGVGVAAFAVAGLVLAVALMARIRPRQ